ncbi:hypothetical protein F0562_014211 [Nyssa sinensis]|uniref:F-box domain-containing protein n=1 Tax=Nyssa sinensis TaxID=561372 RepID=A0A5J4ZPH5_9ASTE|nr:hypothetical protein F0562_014211 [Nyssa sinensis]
MESESSSADELHDGFFSRRRADGFESFLKKKSVDRISSLPDTVLVHILSFLPTKDAIKTTVLSKKWQFLWTLVPTLHFYDPKLLRNGDIHSFVNFIDQTLILHNAPKITKFRLELDYYAVFKSRVNLWVRFAVRREVEELDLDLLGAKVIEEFYGKPYKLPINFCMCSTVTKLSLRYCRFTYRNRTICWKSIKSLSLGYMQLTDALIRDILLGTPVLEVLELRECSGLNRLDINSERLNRLGIYGYGDFCKSDSDLVISAPKLRSLGIYGLFRRKCRLVNVKSLDDATLKFKLLDGHGNRDNSDKGYCKIMEELLLSLISVKNLTIATWCIQVSSILEVVIKHLPLLLVKCLILVTRFDKWDLPGIKCLLSQSILLEKLLVDMHSPSTSQFSFDKKFIDSYNFDGENYWASQKLVIPCLKNHLKTVEITGFSGGQHAIGFIQFILKNALVLEKMVICAKRAEQPRWMKDSKAKELLEVVQKMLSFRRASASAEILFSW